MRRLALFRITPEVIVKWCTAGEQPAMLTENGLPRDAKVLGTGGPQSWFYDPYYHSIAIVIESESFPEVPEGQPLPTLPVPQFKRIGEAEK